MADHLSPTELRGFLARALPADEILRADGHLARCADCRHALASLADPRAARRLVESIRHGGTHLPYESIEAFVDGRLAPSERAEVETHAAGCPSCGRELAEMASYAGSLARPAARRGDESRSLAERLRTWFGGPGPLRAALAVLVAAVGVTVLLRGGMESSSPGVDSARDPSTQAAGTPAGAFVPGEFDRSALDTLGGSLPEAHAAYRAGDYARVGKLAQTAADEGNLAARVALGLLYAEGRGVARDPAAAEGLWREAAAAGDAAAAHNLGVLYDRGLLGAKDEAEARRWYERAQRPGGR